MTTTTTVALDVDEIESIDKTLKIGDIRLEILLDSDVWHTTPYFTIAGLHRAIMEYINIGDEDKPTSGMGAYDYENNTNVKQARYYLLVTMSLENQKKGKFSYPFWERMSKTDKDRWYDKEEEWERQRKEMHQQQQQQQKKKRT